MSAKHGVSYSMYPHYKMRRRFLRYSSQKNKMNTHKQHRFFDLGIWNNPLY